MQDLAYTSPSRQQSFSACSRPSPVRLFSLTVFAALGALCLYVLAGVTLQAQTAHPGGVIPLGSGFSTPTGVTVDGSGNVYVADNGNSAVKRIAAVNGRIPASPVINTLGSGFANPFTVAVDGSGNVIVTDYGNHKVKEILANSGYTTVRTLDSDVSFIFGTAVDAQNDVFFTDYGRNMVEELLAVNGTIPAVPKILSLGGGFNIPAGLAVDASGNVFVGDQNNNAVKEILASSGYTTTITVATGFSTPDGVAIDPYENVYVANDGGNSVEEILAVNGVIPPSPSIITLGGGFLQPFDVAVDGSGNVYVADRGNNAVKEIQLPGANFGQVPVGTTTVGFPVSFTFDTGGTLGSYAVVTLGDTGMDFQDAGGGTCIASTVYSAGQSCTVNVKFGPLAPGARYGAVKLLSTAGAMLATNPLEGVGLGPQATFAVDLSGVLFPSSSVNVGSGFSGPGGAAVDVSGNIFVADSYNNAVKEVMAAGNWTTVNTLGSGFLFPNGVALDGGGNVYVADSLNDAVKEIVAAGGYTTVITLGSGFANPYGVAVDGRGNVFVADYSNGAVKEMLAVGGSISNVPIIRTLASGLDGPDGVAVDGNGNVFVAVYGDGTVREIQAVNGSVPASPVIKTIGTGFNGPSNLSVDGIGNVFVSNTGSGQVVEIVAAGGYTTGTVLAGPFTNPEATAVWGNGDVIFADAGSNAVTLLDYAGPPALAFATTPAGSTSSDSPRTVTVSNDGNAPLTFPLPGSGTNPSIPANFAWDHSSTCLQTTPSSSQAFALAGGTSCMMAFDFKPAATGSFSSPAVLTDNNLNLPNSTQSIQLTGTGTGAPAVLTSPTPGSTLSGTSATFTWSAGVGVTMYEFRLGTTGAGSSNVYNAAGTTTTALSSPLITGIPAYGVTLYARLFSLVNGTWQHNDYTYTESGSPVLAALTSPTPGSTLGTSATFTWTAGGGPTLYEFRLGTSGLGSNNIYNGTATTALSSPLVTGIPANGATLYARLYSYISDVWQYQDYTYTESGTPAAAVLTSPTLGATLSGSSATFTWTAGRGVTMYEFRLGTTGPGSSNVYNAAGKTTTALTTGLLTNLPTTGGTLYARLYSYINGAWQHTDYTFTEK